MKRSEKGIHKWQEKVIICELKGLVERRETDEQVKGISREECVDGQTK